MADELNIPTHRWYQPRYNISLPNSDFSKQWIFNSGIQKIDAFIGGGFFSPSALFALAEPGVWFDPSDLTTLFQDPAGTTPVTGPTGPTGLPVTVGLMLDKSKGLALGAELVTPVANQDFSSDTGYWTKGSGVTISGGSANWSAATSYGLYRAGVAGVSAGNYYEVTFTVSNYVSGTIRVYLGSVPNLGPTISANGTYTTRLGVTGSGEIGFFAPSGAPFTGSIDNFSVKALAGNHATQGITAARPTYSIEPVGGRRNLLTQTELFSDADWVKSSVTPVSAQTVSYAGGLGTPNSRYVEQLKTIAGGTASKTFTISALVSGTGKIRLKGTQIGIADHYSANITLSSTPTLVQYTMTNGASSGTGVQAGGFVAATDDVAFTLTATNVQFELGSTATAYQRVTTQHDVTEAGVASVGYLYFDGASDNMVTSTITPGTDKAQVFAGVRKINDATRAMIVESGATGTDLGSFGLNAPRDGTRFYLFIAGGSLLTSSQTTSSAFAAPVTNVISGLANIAGDSNELRLNGVQAGTATGDQGTGNFTALPLYLGGRGGTSLFLTGNLYSLITRFGPTLDAATIASTETWVAGKTGFYTPIITGVPTIGVS